MLVLNLVTLVTAVANMALGFLVLTRGKGRVLHTSFFIFSFIAGLWVFTNYYFAQFGASLFIFKSQYALGGALSLSALPWLLSLTGNKPRSGKLWAIYIAGILLLLLPLLDGLVIKRLIHLANGQFDFETG